MPSLIYFNKAWWHFYNGTTNLAFTEQDGNLLGLRKQGLVFNAGMLPFKDAEIMTLEDDTITFRSKQFLVTPFLKRALSGAGNICWVKLESLLKDKVCTQ